MTGRVDIVIVNWNAGSQLAECLASIERHGDGLVGSTIVVDNGSTDGSDRFATGHGVELIRAGRNLGFGAACNLGSRRATADYILLLNPDAQLRAGTLVAAVAFLDASTNARTAVVGVRLDGGDGEPHRHCARFPTWRSFVGPSVGIERLSRGAFPSVTLKDFDHLSDRRVDHVMGAFYLIRRSVFEQVGGFDPAFFVYMEDVDLSRRVAAAGWDIQYLARPSAFHRQGGVSDQVRALRLVYIWESNIIFSWKHHSLPQAVVVSATTAFIEPLSRGLRAVLNGRPGDAATILLAGAKLLGRLPAVLRRAVRARRHFQRGAA